MLNWHPWGVGAPVSFISNALLSYRDRREAGRHSSNRFSEGREGRTNDDRNLGRA